jgi:hypothetical protein
MNWFLKQKKYVNGYTNQYWNGITSLEWAKQSLNILQNWNLNKNIVQLGTNVISKYDFDIKSYPFNFVSKIKKNIINN